MNSALYSDLHVGNGEFWFRAQLLSPVSSEYGGLSELFKENIPVMICMLNAGSHGHYRKRVVYIYTFFFIAVPVVTASFHICLDFCAVDKRSHLNF